MARLARLVVPFYPHHVTQRGNRRQSVFFCDDDYRTYLDFIAEARARTNVSVWAYCLMPNHVHWVVCPSSEDGLRLFFGEAHRKYTRRINFRKDWRGYLWQGRFQSFVMDERHLMQAVRYVELNPVRAGLVRAASDWRWSSVHAHLGSANDTFVSTEPMLSRVGSWTDYLDETVDEASIKALREHAATGRPLGDTDFIDNLEALTGRTLHRQKPGPKVRVTGN